MLSYLLTETLPAATAPTGTETVIVQQSGGKGLAINQLIPQMTGTARDALSSPPEGMLIYNTSTHKLNVRVAAGWEAVTSA